MAKANVWARRKSRRALVQAIYQWQLSGNNVASVLADFREGDALKKADGEYFEEMLRLVTSQSTDLDEQYAPVLDRAVDKLDHVERAVLRLACAEFVHRIDIPYRVVIDEYVELTKTFGAQDAHKYVNGVLDKMATQLRSIEAGARG